MGDLPLYSVAVDASGNVWAASSDTTKQSSKASVQRLNPSSGVIESFDLAGDSTAQYPYGGLAIDAAGHVWIATASNPAGVLDPSVAVVELDPSGSIVTRLHDMGPANPNPCPDSPCAQNPFFNPRMGGIDAGGHVWLLDDDGSGELTVLDSSGAFVRSVTIDPATVDSLAIDAAGDVWALDVFDNRIVRVSAAGVVSGMISLPASVKGGLLNLAIDKSGDLWIAAGGDTAGAGALVELGPSGTQLGLYSVPGPGSADAIAIDAADHIWVVDQRGSRLLSFDTSGAVVKEIPHLPMPGVDPMEGHAIAIDADGNIWIASALDSTASGLLIEAPGVAVGPQYFPYSGPVFP
jgi:streptogramin lyase